MTRLTYTEPVTEEVMECRLGPLWDDDQRWQRFELRVKPSGHIRTYLDPFGNPSHLVTLVSPHETIEMTAEGEVSTLLVDPFMEPEQPPIALSVLDRFDYLQPSRLIPADPRIEELALPRKPNDPIDEFVAARELMEVVHDLLTYVPEATTTNTTLREVLDDGAGVCQDFAHVLIGLCRSIGLPARYVSGYILAGATPDERGPGASHAWAEIYTATHGWRGFDATNNLVASEYHVKMAVGRDYSDVPPTRGTFRGRAGSELAVEVNVKRLG